MTSSCRLIWYPTVLHWSECSSRPHGNLFTCEYLWSENGLVPQKTFKFRGLELKRFTRPVVCSWCQNGFETAVQKLISVELQCWLFPIFALRMHRSQLSFSAGSHAAGYDSDPSTPMVYSCSTQYRIHTHGVFRGIQVGLILLLLLPQCLIFCITEVPSWGQTGLLPAQIYYDLCCACLVSRSGCTHTHDIQKA